MRELHKLLQRKYRIVIDGNGNYRIQFQFTGAMAGLPEWHFDPRIFLSEKDAEKSIGEYLVDKVVKEI